MHEGDGIYSAGSYHPGGVNVAMADGSVQFISESIDAGDSSHPPITPAQLAKGPIESPYRVFGALGTTSGSESYEIP